MINDTRQRFIKDAISIIAFLPTSCVLVPIAPSQTALPGLHSILPLTEVRIAWLSEETKRIGRIATELEAKRAKGSNRRTIIPSEVSEPSPGAVLPLANVNVTHLPAQSTSTMALVIQPAPLIHVAILPRELS